MLLCESCNCRKCNFFFFNLQMSVFFWKFPARMKLIHRALFFSLGKRFFHNFQLLELMILKSGLLVQFHIFPLLLFWCSSTRSDFSYTQKCCGSLPVGNLLQVVRFQIEECHVLCTGHMRVLQTSLHRTVLALRSKSLVSSWESFPFHSSLKKGSSWCWYLV